MQTGIITIPGAPLRLTEPDIKSEDGLIGIDGNAFAIIGTVDKGLRRAGADASYRKEVQDAMTSGDYDQLLQIAVHFTTNHGAGGPEGEDAVDDDVVV